MEQTHYDDRAQRGAELLDLERAGWWQEVAPEALDISSCTACILGQLFGEYDDGVADLFGDAELQDGFPQAKAHGFDDATGDSASYATLAGAWRRIIEQRRDEMAQALADMGWVPSRDALDMISPATGAAVNWRTGRTVWPAPELRPVRAQF